MVPAPAKAAAKGRLHVVLVLFCLTSTDFQDEVDDLLAIHRYGIKGGQKNVVHPVKTPVTDHP
jgi:hypothetical protein